MPPDNSTVSPFWRTKTLAEMTDEEWESLCDRCGRCCLVVLEDDDAPGVFYETDAVCRLFDVKNRCCTDYPNRTARVPDCVRLTPENSAALEWMPKTCAYRRLARGEGLPDWHPLVTGDPESVMRAGIAVKNVVSEADVAEDEFEDRVTGER